MALTVGGRGKLVGPGLPLNEAVENPANFNKRLIEIGGSEDLIDAAELALKGPRIFRDWDAVDKLYDNRYIMNLSMMLTAAALNEINGALALMARIRVMITLTDVSL